MPPCHPPPSVTSVAPYIICRLQSAQALSLLRSAYPSSHNIATPIHPLVLIQQGLKKVFTFLQEQFREQYSAVSAVISMNLLPPCGVRPNLQLPTLSPALLALPPLLVPRVKMINQTTGRDVRCRSSTPYLRSRESRIVIQIEGLLYDDNDDVQ